MKARIKKRPYTKLIGGGAVPGASLLGGTGSGFLSSTLAGPAVGMVSSLITSELQRKKQEQQQQASLNQMYAEREIEDAALLEDYPTNGILANGGNIPPSSSFKGKYATIGGKSKTIGKRVEELEGNTHGENKIDGSYGVTLIDPNTGLPKAEAEDEEVIVDGDYVFSDRLTVDGKTTFAKKMKSLTLKRNKIEKKLEDNTDTKSRNGYERMLAGFDMAEDVLKVKQEQAKAVEGEEILGTLANGGHINQFAKRGISIYADGGTLPRKRKDVLGNNDEYTNNLDNPSFYNPIDPEGRGIEREELSTLSLDNEDVNRDTSTFDYLAPNLLDNAVNLGLTLNSPKLAKPLMKRALPMKTTFNVNPQISAIKNAVGAASDNILKNTSNSNIARANIASAKLSGAKQLGDIYANKENIETQLSNADTMNRQGISNTNTDILANQNMLEFTRANDIQSRLSGNVADFSKDVNEAMTRTDMDKYYDEAMLLSLLDDKTGDKARVMSRNPYFAKSSKLKNAMEAENKRSNRK